MKRWTRLLLMSLVAASPSAIADDRAKRAEEELERQLREMVSIPKPRVVITFQALEVPGFKVESAEFMLDGRVLSAPSPVTLSKEGTHRVYSGEVPEGRHELITRVTYVDDSSVLVSSQAGFKWRIARHLRFETQDGLEVTVNVIPERLSGEPDPKKQLVLQFDQDVKMLAKVDTSLPPPPKPKVVAAAETPDAGVPEAAEDPAKAAEASQSGPAVEEDDEDEDAPATAKRKKRRTRTKKQDRKTASKGKVEPTRATRDADEPTWDRRSVRLAAVDPEEELDVPALEVAASEVADAGAPLAAAAPADPERAKPEEPKTAGAVPGLAEMPLSTPMVIGVVVVLVAVTAVLVIRRRRRS